MIKIFLDLDGTLARFNVRNALQRFENEIGFFENLLPYKNIGEVDRLANKRNVYIISASPNIRCDLEKMFWVRKYLPSLPIENIIICRVGDNKAEKIKQELGIDINAETYLLDDYTKNLVEWETAGGVGVKRLTSVADNSTGKWKGLTIKDLTELRELESLA